MSLVAVVAVVGGVAAFSAFEAHVINVTAHIENALSVNTTPIEFGTVFPQEYVEKQFDMRLSDSFLQSGRVDDVEYVINQKSKCKAADPQNPVQYVPVNYWDDECPAGYAKMLSLCPFLSKTDADPEDKNDTSEPSYFVAATDGTLPVAAHCQTVTTQAGGRLTKEGNDISDAWIVDLKVPPVAGTVGQDWPTGCPTVPENEKDYGCDLWIEVGGLSYVEEYPKTGTAYIGYEDWPQGDFDYNDFGMYFSAKEYYNKVGGSDYLTKVIMNFTAVIYDSGAEHYIHNIKRPFVGSYTYKVTRSAPDYPGETPAGTYLGSGDLDVVLFNTIKYPFPDINIGETVTVEVTVGNPSLNPRVALPAPRPDLDPFMANYDPYEVVYGAVNGTFHLNQTQIITSTANQKNTSRIIPVGTELPFILVIPATTWRTPHEDTTITSPYWHFADYYDGLMSNWGPAWTNWYANLDPAHSFVGLGGLAF